MGEVEAYSHTHITCLRYLGRRGRRGRPGAEQQSPRGRRHQTTPASDPTKHLACCRLLLLPLPMPHHPHHRPHRHRRRRGRRAVVVGCRAGWKWPRSLQSASVSAVPMQRRAGRPPISASTCTLLVARSQWRLLTRWVSVPRAPLFSLPFSLSPRSSHSHAGGGCFVSSEAMSRRLDPPSPSPRLPRPAEPPCRVPLPRLGRKRKGSQRQAGTMLALLHGQSGISRHCCPGFTAKGGDDDCKGIRPRPEGSSASTLAAERAGHTGG